MKKQGQAKKKAAKVAKAAKTAASKRMNISPSKVRGTRAPQLMGEAIVRELADQRRLAKSREAKTEPVSVAPTALVEKKKADLPTPTPSPAAVSHLLTPQSLASFPARVAEALVLGAGYFVRLLERNVVVECAPDATEAIGEPYATVIEAKLHEKKLLSFLIGRLEQRDEELKSELREDFDMIGVEKLAVRALWAKPVESHNSRIDGPTLLQLGVSADVVARATIKKPYKYIGIYDPEDKGPKGGSGFIAPKKEQLAEASAEK